MDKGQFDDILKELNSLKKTTTKLGQAIPKMMEDFYKTISPEKKEEYLKVAQSEKVQEIIKDVAIKIKQMNKK